MRILVVALAGLMVAAAPAHADAPLSAAETYQHQSKSVALAVTLEALSPIAGIGCFYAGASDRASVLAVVSAGALGAGVGGALWLIDLSRRQASGLGRATLDFEQGSALTLLIVGGMTYLIARISGLELAPAVVNGFNDDLRQRLELPPVEPTVPYHAWATLPTLAFQF